MHCIQKAENRANESTTQCRSTVCTCRHLRNQVCFLLPSGINSTNFAIRVHRTHCTHFGIASYLSLVTIQSLEIHSKSLSSTSYIQVMEHWITKSMPPLKCKPQCVFFVYELIEVCICLLSQSKCMNKVMEYRFSKAISRYQPTYKRQFCVVHRNSQIEEVNAKFIYLFWRRYDPKNYIRGSKLVQ